MKPLTIYIAGPISAPTKHKMLDNVQKAFDVALEIAKKGHIFYLPHLSVFFDEYAQEKEVSLPWEYWMEFDDVWAQKCDALFYIASSKGTDIELARAKELGKQIFYSLDEVPKVGEQL
jgi:formate-dependent nitrite reductase cytochrome c552 subunit